ncbi:hypothetical protein EON79_14495 [bacterium]|nr:MAG: hypothetical protein EON79_14495 [bacterium]
MRKAALWGAAFLPLLLLIGCSGGDGKAAYNDDEKKAVEAAKNLTPEQQIENAQKAPLSQEQKDALIQSIKEKNGIK